MIEFNCYKCGWQLSVAGNLAGLQTQCPECQTTLDVPGSPRPKGNGNALAAFILGLLSIIPGLGFITGVLAIICAIYSLASRPTRAWMAVTGLLLGLVLPFVGIHLMVVSIDYAKELGRRAVCQSSLLHLGEAIAMYQSSNDSSCPPSIGVLRKQQDLPRGFLRCPDDMEYALVSYFYSPPAVPRGASISPDKLIACEIAGFHSNGGRSVLFANLVVKYVKDAEFQHLLGEPCNEAFALALRQASDDRPGQIKAMSTLEGIQRGIWRYRQDHHDLYPPYLGGYGKERWFYQPPVREDEQIVACEINVKHYAGGRAVLHADGRTAFVESDESFQAELAKPINAKFAEALRRTEAGGQ